MSVIAMEQEEKELTVAEVATRLRLTKQAVWRRIDAGLLRARKEGKEWRIAQGDLARYIESTYHDSEKK